MKSLPLVSILIPSYNHEIFISECLDSIVRQPYSNLELVIVDDCSTDATPQIIESFIEKKNHRFTRVVFQKHTENLGIPRTFNELLFLASGKYVKYIASDDKLHEESIFPFVEELEKGYDIVYGDLLLITEKGKLIRRAKGLRDIGKNYTIDSFNICDCLHKEGPTVGSAWMMRTESLKKIGGFDENAIIEDWELVCRILSRNLKISYIDKIAAYYRVPEKRAYGGSIIQWLKGNIYILNKYRDLCPGNYLRELTQRISLSLLRARDYSKEMHKETSLYVITELLPRYPEILPCILNPFLLDNETFEDLLKRT